MKKHIDEILDNFDFEKVREVMIFLNWKWFFSSGYRIPTVDEIKDSAIKLLNEVASNKNKTYSVATGGFKASKYDKDLELEFTIEDYRIFNNES